MTKRMNASGSQPNADDAPSRADLPRPWQPRFSLSTLLMVMLVICVMSAAGSYLARILRQDGRTGQLTFILFTLAAPMLLMVLVSLAARYLRRAGRRR
jgi:cation transporter-like permease